LFVLFVSICLLGSYRTSQSHHIPGFDFFLTAEDHTFDKDVLEARMSGVTNITQ
jgi:hypothetical protein